MKTSKSKKRMYVILGILIMIVLLLSITGAVINIRKCNNDEVPPAVSDTVNPAPKYELPMDTF